MAARAHPATGRPARRRPAARKAPSRTRPAARQAGSRRRPAARRGASRVRWDRVGRIALTLVLAAVLVSYLKPALNFFHTYRATTAAKAELRSLQAENRGLHRRVQSVEVPAALELQARRQGMVAPGEQAYVVHRLRG